MRLELDDFTFWKEAFSFRYCALWNCVGIFLTYFERQLYDWRNFRKIMRKIDDKVFLNSQINLIWIIHVKFDSWSKCKSLFGMILLLSLFLCTVLLVMLFFHIQVIWFVCDDCARNGNPFVRKISWKDESYSHGNQ